MEGSKMEQVRFKKDETPYFVFSCTKCNQYSYVKTTQKTKKCLRCGKIHQVKGIERAAEIVIGMTLAVYRVKELQDQYARKELQTIPDFRTEGQFRFPIEEKNNKEFITTFDKEGYESQFLLMLSEISKTYKSFPRYILDIMSDNYGIPESRLPELIRKFEKMNVLRKKQENFTVTL